MTAILTASTKGEVADRGRLTTTRFVVSIFAGIGGAAAIWYKTQEAGWLSSIMAATAVGLTVLLSMSIWQVTDEEKNEGND